jgi:hypothetical protein
MIAKTSKPKTDVRSKCDLNSGMSLISSHGLRKKALRKFECMSLRNEIDVTGA